MPGKKPECTEAGEGGMRVWASVKMVETEQGSGWMGETLVQGGV